MPSHWTYSALNPEGDLEQGDILKPTDDLLSVLKSVHNHFTDSKYLGFLVATQSCDLVMRNRRPGAPYINIAAIRPLSNSVHKLISQACTPAAGHIFPISERGKAKDFLSRVFNQNEQKQGLFFLHADFDAGIAEPSVAMLRVTVALKGEHYDTLRAARAGRLSDEFRAKLGWLLGNLYARPATSDWPDHPGGKKAIKTLTDEYISQIIPGKGPIWIEDEVLVEAKARDLNIEDLSSEQIDQLRPKPKFDRALEEVAATLSSLAPDIDPDVITKLKSRLSNSGKFRTLFK